MAGSSPVIKGRENHRSEGSVPTNGWPKHVKVKAKETLGSMKGKVFALRFRSWIYRSIHRIGRRSAWDWPLEPLQMGTTPLYFGFCLVAAETEEFVFRARNLWNPSWWLYFWNRRISRSFIHDLIRPKLGKKNHSYSKPKLFLRIKDYY